MSGSKPRNKKPTVNLKDAYAVKILIAITNEGKMSVTGFPLNVHTAQKIMQGATGTVMNYFIEGARAGNMDEAGNVTKSKIIKLNKNIIIPGMN